MFLVFVFCPLWSVRFLEPFSAITAAGLLGYVSTNLAHLQVKIVAHYFLHKQSQLIQTGLEYKLNFFKSHHRLTIGFKSRTLPRPTCVHALISTIKSWPWLDVQEVTRRYPVKFQVFCSL